MIKEPKLTKAERVNAERADLVEKPPTRLHYEQAAYTIEMTGYQPPNWEDFVKAFQLCRVLLTHFQRSEVNQARLAESARAKEAEAEPAEEPEPAAAKPARGRGRRAAQTTATTQADAPAPKGRGRRGKAATATAEATTAPKGRRGRRPAAAVAAAEADTVDANENPF